MADSLIQRLDRIEAIVAAQYVPGPAAAERQRPRRPDRTERVPISAPGAVGSSASTVEQLEPCWTSRSLDTHGFTLHEAHVSVDVLEDDLNTLVPGLGNQPVLTCQLQGSFGASWCELDTQTLNSLNGRTGSFVFPALVRTSLALETRVALFLWDLFANDDDVTRTLTFKVDCMLQSGYEF